MSKFTAAHVDTAVQIPMCWHGARMLVGVAHLHVMCRDWAGHFHSTGSWLVSGKGRGCGRQVRWAALPQCKDTWLWAPRSDSAGSRSPGNRRFRSKGRAKCAGSAGRGATSGGTVRHRLRPSEGTQPGEGQWGWEPWDGAGRRRGASPRTGPCGDSRRWCTFPAASRGFHVVRLTRSGTSFAF